MIEEDLEEEDFVNVNSRDFMAALQRLLSVKFKRFQKKDGNFSQPQSSHFFNKDNFTLIRIIEQSENNL